MRSCRKCRKERGKQEGKGREDRRRGKGRGVKRSNERIRTPEDDTWKGVTITVAA